MANALLRGAGVRVVGAHLEILMAVVGLAIRLLLQLADRNVVAIPTSFAHETSAIIGKPS